MESTWRMSRASLRTPAENYENARRLLGYFFPEYPRNSQENTRRVLEERSDFLRKTSRECQCPESFRVFISEDQRCSQVYCEVLRVCEILSILRNTVGCLRSDS